MIISFMETSALLHQKFEKYRVIVSEQYEQSQHMAQMVGHLTAGSCHKTTPYSISRNVHNKLGQRNNLKMTKKQLLVNNKLFS